MAIDKRLIELIPTLPLFVNKEDINEATLLEEDLHLYGYQARSFILKYADEFGINLKGFRFNQYFSRDIPVYRVFAKITRIFKSKKNKLTLGDLQAAIEYKKLNENVLKDIKEKKVSNAPHKKLHTHSSLVIKAEDIIIYILVGITVFIFLAWVTFAMT
ncbi:DUF1493 family protein [Dysgonomonas sp. 216]|uniref:DUF1493 family protein n=1 Tax=Dysgonomonas sp. 216 TaxID=2302934 RepID=UPI0013D33BC3|nr:DUF1493 family protein [Dysgonomonas sp. 216]NDW17535.1 DUF1493 family protein [Dysgonomonas sp. 216]